MDARRKDDFEDAALGAFPADDIEARKSGKGPAQSAPAPKRNPRRFVLAALLLAVLVAGGGFGWRWWAIGRYEITTDNAYLNSDKVTIAPRIAGALAQVFVTDNQPVRRGDTLAQIDDREHRVLLASAEAEAEKASAELLSVGANLAQQRAQVESARADLANADAALTFSQQEFGRYQNLRQAGSGSIQREQQADSDLRQRRAARDKAQAALEAAQQQVENLKAQEAGARAAIDVARARVEQAKLNLEYTKIVAPVDGVVGDRSLRPGQYLTAGTNLLTIVPMGSSIYLVANFKETQTGAISVGNRVSFTLDAFGDHVFAGRVESFSPGTGAQFALLPTENATGNFTKIVQRVPVRIALDPSDPLIGQLRPGLSAEATVHASPAEEPSFKQAELR
jgi:membrane fusion protein, multidrug efflux system